MPYSPNSRHEEAKLADIRMICLLFDLHKYLSSQCLESGYLYKRGLADAFFENAPEMSVEPLKIT